MSRLGASHRTLVEWKANDAEVLVYASQKMRSHGYGPLTPRGKYLLASAMQDKRESAHIGQIRVSFEYDRCADATIIAQQIPGMQPDVVTFKEWDPDQKAMKDKLDEEDDFDDQSVSCFGMLCCYMCMCVNGCFKMMFKETMDHAADGK